MKTGRVRSKAELPKGELEPTQAAPPEILSSSSAPEVEPQTPPELSRPARSPLPWVFVAVGGVLAFVLLFVVLRGCGGAKEWVPVSHVSGKWTTGVVIYAPQVTVQEAWQSECQSQGWPVRADACALRDAATYTDRQTRTYQEYAANTYFEEMSEQVYRAQDTEFVTTSLGGGDRWEGDLHYIWREILKRDTCQQTNYTVWIEDPQDPSLESEVYLFDCEVWNDYTVYQRVYDQAMWCPCEVTTLVTIGRLSSEGSGGEVAWPLADVPAGGRSEGSFAGSVTFTGGDYTFTATTQDQAQYLDWLTGPYYLGVAGGRAVQLTKNPPD
jgi:hypothetical protein